MRADVPCACSSADTPALCTDPGTIAVRGRALGAGSPPEVLPQD